MQGIDPVHVVLMMVPMILSLSWHEFAHALVAKWHGDDTAERQGRLTLNPVVHVDPFGTLLLPAIGALTGVPLIGWAKPVPVNAARFKRGVDRRRGMAIVSAAGPLSNLLLAIIAAGILVLGRNWLVGNEGMRSFLSALFMMNVGLCVFNLLPLAPLDGSRLTPKSMDSFQESIAPYSVFILMGILMVAPLRHILIEVPIMFLATNILRFFAMIF